MGMADAALHALNFMLPAVFVSLLIAFLGRFLKQNKPLAGGFIAQSAIHFIVCMSILVTGLILTGRDGKMYTYLAMVIAAGTTQWILSGGWKR